MSAFGRLLPYMAGVRYYRRRRTWDRSYFFLLFVRFADLLNLRRTGRKVDQILVSDRRTDGRNQLIMSLPPLNAVKEEKKLSQRLQLNVQTIQKLRDETEQINYGFHRMSILWMSDFSPGKA